MRKCRAAEVPFSDCSSNAQKKWNTSLKTTSFTSRNYKAVRFRTLSSNKIGFGMRVQPVGKSNGQQFIGEKNCFQNAGCAPPFCCPCVSEKWFVPRLQTRLQSHYKRLVVSVQVLCSVSTSRERHAMQPFAVSVQVLCSVSTRKSSAQQAIQEVSVQALFSVSTRGLVQMLCSQTELDLQNHRCIVNKQKSSLSSVQGLIDAVLHNVLHPSNNNFPKTILFNYKFTLSIEKQVYSLERVNHYVHTKSTNIELQVLKSSMLLKSL